MSKVISIATGERLDQQDWAANDSIAAKGDYLGRIPKIEATTIRQYQDLLICEKAEIDERIRCFQEHHSGYLESVVNVLIFLGTDYSKFQADKDKLMVSEDGHVWIVHNVNTEGEDQ